MCTKAVIFDLDGTVLDTEKLLVKYWCAAANEFGFPMEREHALQLRSLARKYAEPLLKEWFGQECDYMTLRNRRMELMTAHIAEHGLDVKPGIKELLVYLGENGYKRAVATATDLNRAGNYLKSVDLFDYFDNIISAHQVKNGKPKPDVYIHAVSVLGLTAEECIAVEDSPNGVISASDAGCRTIMIPDLTYPDEDLKSRIFAVCESAEGIIDILKKEKTCTKGIGYEHFKSE